MRKEFLRYSDFAKKTHMNYGNEYRIVPAGRRKEESLDDIIYLYLS